MTQEGLLANVEKHAQEIINKKLREEFNLTDKNMELLQQAEDRATSMISNRLEEFRNNHKFVSELASLASTADTAAAREQAPPGTQPPSDEQLGEQPVRPPVRLSWFDSIVFPIVEPLIQPLREWVIGRIQLVLPQADGNEEEANEEDDDEEAEADEEEDDDEAALKQS